MGKVEHVSSAPAALLLGLSPSGSGRIPEGIDGYFTDDSMLRRVNRERALALSGPRALLMQAAHPLAARAAA